MKKSLFLENAKLLNNEFEIIPLMYGSLGLEYITNQNLNSARHSLQRDRTNFF